MKCKIALLIFCLALISAAQQRPDGPDGPARHLPRGSADLMVQPVSDSVMLVTVFIRVQNDALVFTQDGGRFRASFTVEANAADSLGKHVARGSWAAYVNAASFEETRDPALAVDGLITLSTPRIDHAVRLTFRDGNTSEERELRVLPVRVAGMPPPKVYKSLVVTRDKFLCDTDSLPRVYDVESNIPFSPQPYDLYVPVADSSVTGLKVTFAGREDTVVFTGLPRAGATYTILPCRGKVVLAVGSGTPARLFVASAFNQRLREGMYEMKVYSSGSSEPLAVARVMARWQNRPVSLFEPELAYRVLGIIFTPQAADSLYKLYKKDPLSGLYNIWKSSDPTPKTTFNELMAEFYTRVDYALDSFSTLKGRDGADTDRGRLYIKLGKPATVSRGTTAGGKITEIWYYRQLNKEFTFVENGGTGNYILLSAK